MATSSSDDQRIAKLSFFFNKVIHNERALSTSRDGKLFLEALCVQADPATCAHKLLSTPSGISALQTSVRFDTSISFLNGHATTLLQYFQSPALKSIGSGCVLAKLLLPLVDPPFFWETFTTSFIDGLLVREACHAFAWLLLELVSQPGKASLPYVALVESSTILNSILDSPDGQTRNLGQKIKHALPLNSSELHVDGEARPGGRHDNDHSNHREISIMPTADELLSKERPFLRAADFIGNPELEASRAAIHIDNQFRLLREDMLGEIRDELKVLTGLKSGRHRGISIDNLSISGVNMGTDRKRLPLGVVFKIQEELPQLKTIQPNKKTQFLNENRHILRQGNMVCLLIDNEPVAFPTIHRDEEELSKVPAKITLQFADDATMSKALAKTKISDSIRLAQLDAAIFAFEPFLKRLQEINDLPLKEEILHWEKGKNIEGPSFQPNKVLRRLKEQSGKDLKNLLRLEKSVTLDKSQMSSLCTCLAQRVSLVQGPPGTGKSFIGALLAKILHDSTPETILVVCFTNHALDQFLEDLMDIGIPQSHMVRLGGKSTDRTKPLMVREQNPAKLTPSHWDRINKLKQRLQSHETRIRDVFKRFLNSNIHKNQLLEYLEFLSEDMPFFEAFTIPRDGEDGMIRIGRRGREMSPFYLLDRWIMGQTDSGSLQHVQPEGAAEVWRMSLEARRAALSRWQKAILDDLISEIRDTGRQFNADQSELDRIFSERDGSIIKTKRIIACTTNGAAKYSAAIQAAASPGVVLVEEAGEILEAHILTSLGAHTQQLIMIGDHKQLRPKCSYELSVEQGDGFDLNRSLFERLVLKGFPHVTLQQQHRMRPEISSLIRHLTYPELTNADSTLNREDLRGFRDNVIFVNHSHPEVELANSREMHEGRTSSKQNEFEGRMVLKCVRYLAQQGYGSDRLVVLTPYLGQLKLLREQLGKENDPILNDLDKWDLVRAGLLTDLASKTSKPSLRISTIDNYQGEESDIVVVSLTRSNKTHDIGFMAAPERLNVLLSRARNGLIMIGNSDTFLNARKGKETWRRLFDLLKEKDHIYEGFPVKCEKHPNRTSMIASPEQFESECPDGGCKEPCGVPLNCGLHKCPSSCHQLFDHSKVPCRFLLTQMCSNGHKQSWECKSGPPLICTTCEYNKKQAEKKARKDIEAKAKADAKTQKHQKEIAMLDDELARIKESGEGLRLEKEQSAVLAQKRKDLEAAKERAKKTQSPPPRDSLGISNDDDPKPRNPTSNKAQDKRTTPAKATPHRHSNLREHINTAVENNKCSAKTEWQRQKDQENAANPAIDSIMEMIGLEDVKKQVLRIKSKVATSVRQGTDLKKERLGLVLLGNPGTGKTTVARHYAKVLTSLNILAGDGFVETTGSRLAHGGVAEVKNHLQELKKTEGGVYFIDEAYQLAEGHNYGGKTVLDFLLAEIENLTGQVVFVFAGYRKEMEKFFEHNPGLPSRIPYVLHFEDYTDDELLKMLQFRMNRIYNGGIDVEDGFDGLYMRIAVRRLGRGRGRNGFGNARALENVFSRIQERQSDRLDKERRQGLCPDDFLMTKEDLIGPDPSKAILACDAYAKLQQLIGLKDVKNSIDYMVSLIKTNYERELKEQQPIDVSLNRVFLGSPGTGKTTVAKLYGRILADIGMLSNGEVVTKNPADFIGNVIGASEANTKAILATTVGKVLIIDEAYMLYSGSGSGGGTGVDIYKTAVIDTIVAEVQSVPGDDRCVLLLGYEEQMSDMFQNVNPGLARRFQFSSPIHFQDYNDQELEQILRHKLKIKHLSATELAVSTAIGVLSRLRNGLKFGNGGEVENQIAHAQANYQTRQLSLPAEQQSTDFIFEPQDFDLDYDRASSAETNLQELFAGVIGCEEIVSKLGDLLKLAKTMRARGLDPLGQIPMNFVFKGPPGTGKTTTARKFGQVYYDLGLLSQVEVVECSAGDLTGEYVGQTTPKTIRQLERALGKVLFIDEAYKLAQGPYGHEAINEIVDAITKPKFAGKLVIILAGYSNDMNRLLQINEGLSSRFADEVVFSSLTASHCLQLLEKKLHQSTVAFPSMHEPAMHAYFLTRVQELSKLPAWGNARDVETLAKSMVRKAFLHTRDETGAVILNARDAKDCIESMLEKCRERASDELASQPSFSGQAQASNTPPSVPQVTSNTSTAMKTATNPDIPVEMTQDLSPSDDNSRDPGVSDAIWERLQLDKKLAENTDELRKQAIRKQEKAYLLAEEAEEEAKKKTAALLELEAKNQAKADGVLRKQEEARVREIEAKAEEAQKAARRIAADLLEMQAKIAAEAYELLRKREQARIREAEAKAERERARKEIERVRLEETERRKKEERVQVKLREIGICPMGYRWIKQGDGYRCSAGGHWVSKASLGF